MDHATARSVLGSLVPRRRRTQTQKSPGALKRRYILQRIEKRRQMVGTGGTEMHTLHEWAALVGNPPAAGGRGIRRVDPCSAPLAQSLSAATFPTRHVVEKGKKKRGKKNIQQLTIFIPCSQDAFASCFFFFLFPPISHLYLSLHTAPIHAPLQPKREGGYSSGAMTKKFNNGLFFSFHRLPATHPFFLFLFLFFAWQD